MKTDKIKQFDPNANRPDVLLQYNTLKRSLQYLKNRNRSTLAHKIRTTRVKDLLEASEEWNIHPALTMLRLRDYNYFTTVFNTN